jgi:hypothetical protein
LRKAFVIFSDKTYIGFKKPNNKPCIQPGEAQRIFSSNSNSKGFWQTEIDKK